MADRSPATEPGAPPVVDLAGDGPGVDWAVEDLRLVVDLALARGGDLLTAGEAVVARRIRALEGPPAGLYARLTGRVGTVFAEDRLGEAVAVLVEAGLADRVVPWRDRLAASTVEDLKGLCREASLAVGGTREALIARLLDRPARGGRRFVRVRHRGLVHRLEQWALLHRRPDRRAFVVARLGHVRWPEYAVTGGASLHARRADLLAWEALWAGRDDLPPEALLAALGRAGGPSGGLDVRPSIVARVAHAARERERTGDPAGARALYEGLVAGGHAPASRLAVRVARTYEAEGRDHAAWEHLGAVRADAIGDERVAIGRAGRRLAARLRRGWAPDVPLRTPTERDLALRHVGLDVRPTWRGGDVEGPVEHAVIGALAASGRRALHAEGPLWTTLFALLFADAYFLPVPAMLPTPFLPGPLDLGGPAFAARRAAAVAAVLAAVAAGEAPDRVRAADAKWRGTWLAGAAWHRATAEDLVAVAQGMGPSGLVAVLEALLGGWSASRGLPDLVVLPGPSVRLGGAFPATIPAGLVLAEVKGPTDSVRDEQAVWFDRLLAARIPVELWHVRAGTPQADAAERPDPRCSP